jgi:hypothetical protein
LVISTSKLYKPTKQKLMLEQTKVVLSNVSFDLDLFKKELTKAIKWLNNKEIISLKKWCKENFSGEYNKIAMEIIQPQLAL